jgi:tryptophan synthase alpha chain
VKALVVYLMAMPDTPALAEAAVGAGADIIELGFPFSDPLADGPVIRRAGERALAAGMRTPRCLDVLAETRSRVSTPLIPMTYSSILDAYGWERFAADAEEAGATSLIIADLPADERPETRRVQMVAPTSTDERIALVARLASGFVYYVSVTGITGSAIPDTGRVNAAVARIKRHTKLPVAVGFGVKTAHDARAIAAASDGVVVGSALVEAIRESLDAEGRATAKTIQSVTDLVTSLAEGVRSARRVAAE